MTNVFIAALAIVAIAGLIGIALGHTQHVATVAIASIMAATLHNQKRKEK